MALRRFYLSPAMVRHPRPEITGSDAGHICRVLRLGADDFVELFDGTGSTYLARIISASPGQVQLTITESFDPPPDSGVRITLAQGILKERKMDDLVRQLTELGIHRWMPFFAARSVPVPNSKGLGKRMDRWQKIVLEAAKQCRRGKIPQIEPAARFEDVIDASAESDLKIIFWEGTLQSFDIPGASAPQPREIMVMVGPEGGFDPAEVRCARECGFITAGLGPRILRAETAALAACTLVQYQFGDMGHHPFAPDTFSEWSP